MLLGPVRFIRADQSVGHCFGLCEKANLFKRYREHVIDNLFADIDTTKILHQPRPHLLDAAIVFAGIVSAELAVKLTRTVYAEPRRQRRVATDIEFRAALVT